MSLIKPFESGDRICFIGDSITEMTYWIAGIADYYSKKLPQEKIKIYPCGIAGGNCISAIAMYREETLVWSPNTVVIMLGMNDIWRDNYVLNPNDENIAAQKQALIHYERNLGTLVQLIKMQSPVKRIILLAPTPYDEEQNSEEYNLIGCWNALKKCGEICKKTAKSFGIEFFNFGGKVFDLLKKSRDLGSKNELINPDRVHPSDLGMSVMARVFLEAQGFNEMIATPKSIADNTAFLELSETAKIFLNYGHIYQRRWTAEWLIQSENLNQTKAGKIEFANNNLEKFKDEPTCKLCLENYEKYLTEENKLTLNLKDAVDALWND